MSERLSIALDGDTFRIVKVFSNTSNGDRAQYKTMRVSFFDTFNDLKLRVLDKYGISRNDETFYFLSIQYVSDVYSRRRDVAPSGRNLVIECLRDHDTSSIGETSLFLNRICGDNMNAPASKQQQQQQLDFPVPSLLMEHDQMTEYFCPPSSNNLIHITQEVLGEISSISLKTGFLSKYHCSSGVWRDVLLYLTDDRLYYGYEPDWAPHHSLVLGAGITANLTDDMLSVNAGQMTLCFRGQNRAVLQQWASAIILPQEFASDNAMFYELENISQQESFCSSVLDVEYMLDCIKFNNMVKNRFFRRLFREYLTNSHADETYKFVEYAEDFYRSHPMSSKPFSSPELNEVDDSGNSVWLQAWAVELFRVFIQDQGAQQIGCCSSVDKSEIENLLHSPSFDIFRKVQLNTLEYVENTMHSQFLLQRCMRKALQNASNYMRRKPGYRHQEAHNEGNRDQSAIDGRAERWGIKMMIRRIQSRKKSDTLLTGGSVSGHLYKQHWRNVTVGGSNFVEWMPDYWYEGEDTTVLSSFESTNTHDICWEEKNKALYSLLPPWLKRLTGTPNVLQLCFRHALSNEKIPRSFQISRLLVNSFRGVCDLYYPFYTKHIPSGAPTEVVEWKKMVLMVIGYGNDEGIVRMYDADGQIVQLYLGYVSKLIVSPSIIHTIELHDTTGSFWLLRPEFIDNHTCTTQFALNVFEKYCYSSTEKVTICHEGFLSKRGLVNRAYQKRWFVLDSDCKWRYFKHETGQCKGEISISNIQQIAVTGRELNVSTKEREWSFLSESDEDAEFWRIALLSVYDRSRSEA